MTLPTCASAKFNGILSFHAFPTHSDLRRQWLVNIRRDHFTITSHTRVCCRHFASDQLIEPTTLDGRRRLIKGAVPTLFEWNGYKQSLTRDHDYCSVPEPSALDISASAAEDLSKDVETLRKEIQELRVQREFGLQRFAGSDTDIRFYTRYI
uniref:THAP domain-containing protein 1 n=1 Tax=Astatotilapia calliptera TaxID=8154 RepID=A0A3P8P3J3_ASTCA